MDSKVTADHASPTGSVRTKHDEPLSMRQLEVFVALIQHGSFTRAAQHLGLSQPTVSGHMADLENRLGMRLVERVRSGVRPTAEGETLLGPARDALRGELNLRLAAAEIRGLVAGSLVVGGSTIPAVYLLPQKLAEFRTRHEKVRLQVETGSSQEILDAVAAGEIEVGVTGAPATRQRGLRSTVIGRDRLVLICHPKHAFARLPRVTKQQVIGEYLILRNPGSGTRAAMLQGLGVRHPDREVPSFLHVDGTDAVKASVRAGLGISFVSDLAAREEIANGSLATTEVEDFDAQREFYAVAREDDVLSPAAREFYAVLLGESSRAERG